MPETSNANTSPHNGLSLDELNTAVEQDPFLFVLCACDVAHLPKLADDTPHPGDAGFRLAFALNQDGPTLELCYDSVARHLVLLARLGNCTATRHAHWMAQALKTQARWMVEQGLVLFIDPEDDQLCFQKVLPFEGLEIGPLAIQIGDMIQKALDWTGKANASAPSTQPPSRLSDFILVKGT